MRGARLGLDRGGLNWMNWDSVQRRIAAILGWIGINLDRLGQLLAETEGAEYIMLVWGYGLRTMKDATMRRTLWNRTREEYSPASAVIQPLEWGGYIIRPDDAKFKNVADAPNDPGIYGWYTADQDLVYIGRSTAIASRLRQHQRRTFFWGGDPVFFSFRTVPLTLIAGVECAHIRALGTMENSFMESKSVAFGADLETAIQQAWEKVFTEQRDRVSARYHALAEKIAARL
jgi:hypothetical protein